ncbi:MAG: ParB/RepB/Spo0J family partition protein [Acidobacteria bacterium]|nr:ParB/RepB/Spo0J family partition protein [Acidobacteriota bacterium]
MSDPAAKRGLPLRVKMRHSAHFVEELAHRHETPVGKMVPLSAIEPDPAQPRKELGDLGELVSSIRDKGVLEPILVRLLPPDQATDSTAASTPSATGEPPGAPRYAIISGERRFRAALEAGLFEVPAIEMEVSEKEALEIALIENLQRKDLTVFEEAEGYQALADLHQYTQEEIGRAVGKSRSLVAETLSLLRIPPELRSEAHALGIVSRSTLLEVAKAKSPEQMRSLLESIGARGLTRDDLRRDTRSQGRGSAASSGSRKPYVFKFRAPDKTFSLNLTFRQRTVDRDDLIRALEQILQEIRSASDD